MRRLDKSHRLEIVPSQGHGVRDRTGVTAEEAEHAAWTVAGSDPTDTETVDTNTASTSGATLPVDAVKVGGARSIALALSVGRDARWPMLAWKLPGASRLLDRLYAMIARHRHRLPGEVPWCEAHPDDCTSATD